VGILEVLTIVFVALKLLGVIGWSWWLVLLPEIIAVVIYLLWLLLVGLIVSKSMSTFFKEIFRK
jgi:hypothetical protein